MEYEEKEGEFDIVSILQQGLAILYVLMMLK